MIGYCDTCNLVCVSSVRGLAGEHLGAAAREAAGCDQGDGPGRQRGASQTGSAREGQRTAGRAGGQGTQTHIICFLHVWIVTTC